MYTHGLFCFLNPILIKWVLHLSAALTLAFHKRYKKVRIMPSQTTLTSFRLFLDHLQPSIDIFYLMNVDKNQHFLSTYPPPPVNVICEQPLK